MTLPTMTKGKHWLWIGLSYIICFVLAFLSFMVLPPLGLIFIPLPTILTITGVVLYLKNTSYMSKR
jgi:hypothetical protein